MPTLGEQNPPTDFQSQEAAEAAEQEFRDSVLARDKSAEAFKTAYRARLGAPLPDVDPRVQPPAFPDPLEQTARQNIDRMEQIAREIAPERQRAADQLAQEQRQTAQDIAGTQIPSPPGRPKPIPVPTREGSIDQTAAKSLFAVASVIGALGMLGGRGRGMLAMSGMTGAINGFQEGNREKFEAGLKTYDREVRQQLDQYQMAHQEYLDTVNNTKLNWYQKMLSLELKAKAFEDPIMAKAAEMKDLGEITKHIDEFEKNRINLQNHLDTDLLKFKMAGVSLERAQLGVEKERMEIEKLRQGGGKGKDEILAEVTRLQAERTAKQKRLSELSKEWHWTDEERDEAETLKTDMDNLSARIQAGLSAKESQLPIPKPGTGVPGATPGKRREVAPGIFVTEHP